MRHQPAARFQRARVHCECEPGVAFAALTDPGLTCNAPAVRDERPTSNRSTVPAPGYFAPNGSRAPDPRPDPASADAVSSLGGDDGEVAGDEPLADRAGPQPLDLLFLSI